MDGAIERGAMLLREVKTLVATLVAEMPPESRVWTTVAAVATAALVGLLTAWAALVRRKCAPRSAPEGTAEELFLAVYYEDMAALRPLLRQWSGHDVLNWASPGHAGMSALIAGSRLGKVDAVRLLLATPGINVNQTDNDGCTAIMYAAYKGHTEVVRALLAAPGIDLNKRAITTGDWCKGKTALGLALMENKLEIAALLRAAGAEEEHKEEEEHQQQEHQQQEQHQSDMKEEMKEEEKEELKEEKTAEQEEEQEEEQKEEQKDAAPTELPPSPTPSASPETHSETAQASQEELAGQLIYDAAKAGDMDILGPLVQEWSGNADVLNWANDDFLGFTALIAGSYEGNVGAVGLLIRTPGIDVNKADDGGMTAIMLAALRGHIDIVTTLLAAPGIDINKRAIGATTTDDDGAATTAPTDNGADGIEGVGTGDGTGDGDGEGLTALGLALDQGYTEIAALLRAAGAEE